MKQEEKKKVSIRHELRKLYDEGYTAEQMEEFVKNMFINGEITFDDIVEGLVKSRRNDITFENKLQEIKKVFNSIPL
jgi:hypothetical protein